jgi:hypothetical protein
VAIAGSLGMSARSFKQPLYIFYTAMDGIFLKTSLQRSFRLLGFVLVMMSPAIASPAAERGPGASSQAPAKGLVVTANFTDQEVDASFAITLNLSRPLQRGIWRS